MAAALETIKGWFDEAQSNGYSHMVVMVDSFDYEDYPIFVKAGEDPRAVAEASDDLIMECYRVELGWEVQAAEHRANHWEMS
jgi:hypothetical protein